MIYSSKRQITFSLTFCPFTFCQIDDFTRNQMTKMEAVKHDSFGAGQLDQFKPTIAQKVHRLLSYLP